MAIQLSDLTILDRALAESGDKALIMYIFEDDAEEGNFENITQKKIARENAVEVAKQY